MRIGWPPKGQFSDCLSAIIDVRSVYAEVDNEQIGRFEWQKVQPTYSHQKNRGKRKSNIVALYLRLRKYNRSRKKQLDARTHKKLWMLEASRKQKQNAWKKQKQIVFCMARYD